MLNYFLKMMDGGKVNFGNIKAGAKLEDVKDSKSASIFKALDGNNNNVIDEQELRTFLEKVKDFASGGNKANLGDKEFKALQQALGEKFSNLTKEELLTFIKQLSENTSGLKTVTTHPNGETEYIYEDGSRVMTHPDGMTEYIEEDGSSVTRDKDGNITNRTIKKGSITIAYRKLDDGGTEYVTSDETTGVTETEVRDKNGKVVSQSVIEDGVETKTNYLDNGVKEISTIENGVTTTTHFEDKNGNLCDRYGNPLETAPTEEETAAEEETPKQTRVVVQNGESIAALAKKFGCTAQEIIDANPGLVKGKAPNQYFLAGEEITIPREVSAEALAGRQTKEEAEAAYTAMAARQQAIETEAAARKPITWTERNYNTFEEIAIQLFKREGLANPTKEQIDARIEDLKKSNPDLKDGELKGKKIKANVNEGMYERIQARNAKADEYNQKVDERQNAEALAKEFYDIADNNSGYTSMRKMQAFLDEKVTDDNIEALLDAYDNAKQGDSSIIDTVTSEVMPSGDRTAQKHVLRTIMAKLIEAARKAGVSEGDIKKANDDFEASIKKEYDSRSSAFRRTNPLEMEKAIDFLIGAIAAKKTDNVEEMTDAEAINAFNEDFAANDAEAQTAYKDARAEEGWAAKVGDTVCGWFGCTTIEEMDAKLGKNAEAVKRLATANTEEEFKAIYKEIFGIEFDKNKIAARDAALSNYYEAAMLDATINVISDLLKTADGMSYNDLRSAVKEKFQLDDEKVDAIIASYANSLDIPADSDDAKRTLMLQFLRDTHTNSSEAFMELTKGKTLEQMGKDLELLNKSAFGTNDIVKDVVQFNQNMVMTEMITEGAFEVAGTIALAFVPGLGQAAMARLAVSAAKWGNKAVKLTNTLKKAEKLFETADKLQKGKALTSNIANRGTQIGSQMVNAGVATAAVDLSNGDEVKEVVRKTLMNMSFAGVGASSSVLAPKLMKAFGINKVLANEIAEEIINAAGTYGVTKISGDDYGSTDAFIDFVTGLVMARVSHVKQPNGGSVNTPTLDKASSQGNAVPSSVKVGEKKAAQIRDEVVAMLNDKTQTGKGINEIEFKQINEYLATITDEAQLKELQTLLAGKKMTSAQKKQLKEAITAKAELLKNTPTPETPAEVHSKEPADTPEPPAAVKSEAPAEVRPDESVDTPENSAAVKNNDPANVKPEDEVKPESIKDDVDSISRKSIPREIRKLWKNCKKRIKKVMSEAADIAAVDTKTVKERGKALLNKCETLITDLKTIAANVTGDVKVKIQNIINNLQTMVKQKLAKLGDSVQNMQSSSSRRAGVHHKAPTSAEDTALPYSKKVTVASDSKIVLGGQFVLDLSDPRIREILSDGRIHTVGRSGDIQIPDAYNRVSRKHLEIQLVGDRIVVRDISSNGSALREELPVINEDELVRTAGNNGKTVNADYVRTSREARAHFNDAIESGDYTRDLDSYIATMNRAHQIAYAGKDGRHEWYSKAGGGSLDIHPGEIRKSGSLRNLRLKEAQEVEAIARKYGDPYRVTNETQRVKLKGIPEEYQPSDMYFNGGYVHYYPDAAGLEKYYYKEMHRTAKEALDLIERGASEKEILYKLAEHYQYAANARPYGQINNSLFMNEINTLLTRAGMKTMPHGMLDHAAQRLQPDAFKKYFADEYYKTAVDTPSTPVETPAPQQPAQPVNNSGRQAAMHADASGGIAQAINFNATHRINVGEKVSDGYRDAGRSVRFDTNGNITNPEKIYRETIVVDRTRDKKLQQLINDIKSKTANMTEKQKAQYLQEYVHRLTGDGHSAMNNLNAWEAAHKGQDVLLGDIVTNKPPIAVCRHRSLLYKILGDEIGLKVELQRGNFYSQNGGGGHAWNTVRFSDGTSAIFDAMHNRSASTTPGNVDDYAKYYYDVNNRSLYKDGLAPIKTSNTSTSAYSTLGDEITGAKNQSELDRIQAKLNRMPDGEEKSRLQAMLNKKNREIRGTAAPAASSTHTGTVRFSANDISISTCIDYTNGFKNLAGNASSVPDVRRWLTEGVPGGGSRPYAVKYNADQTETIMVIGLPGRQGSNVTLKVSGYVPEANVEKLAQYVQENIAKLGDFTGMLSKIEMLGHKGFADILSDAAPAPSPRASVADNKSSAPAGKAAADNN